MSKLTLNIVEPASPTPAPVDPGIDPVVPNTGLFTSGIGSTEATIIAITSAVLLLTIVAIVLAVLYKKHKKQGRTTKLVHIIDSCKSIIKSKKRVSAGLAAIALLASAGTFATLLSTANKNNTNALEAEDGLTLDISGGDITIEVGDEPVFAIAEVKATVAEETPAGYTLTAYTDSTDLVSTTDSSKVIPMITASEGELSSLTDNTYGLSLTEPETQEEKVYTSLSTDQSDPTFITDKDYEATEANDTTTIYYGFYITPDVPYGTYTGTDINYAAEPHYITNLSFNGNGSDGGDAMEGITILAGDTITLPENTYTKEGYSFTGWNTVAEPTEQDPGEAYADQADYTAELGETKDVTLYAQWEEATLYMQDVANWGSTLQIGDEITVVDSRDGTEYTVARLTDNNIWMTQNLDFDIINGGADLDSINTDVPQDWADAGNLTNTYTDTTWGYSTTAPESYDPGDLYWDGTLNTNWDGNLDNETVTDPSATSGGTHYHIGNYYNWTAAVAMSNSSSYTSRYTDVNQSICPAGWRLPTYSGDKSYQELVSTQSLTAGTSGNIQNSPVYFVYGAAWGGSSGRVGSDGNYWSSVVNGSYDAYLLNFNVNGSLDPQNYGGRSNGYSVRCVAR